MTTTILFLLIGVFLVLGAPVFTILAAIALVGFYTSEIPLSTVGTEVFRLSGNTVLISIPLFTFAGFLLGVGNAPKRMVRLARALFGWMPGGLAIVTMMACAFFTAFNGASGVTIITMGGLLFPILLAEKYKENFSLGMVTTCGCLGLLFAPSVPLILYAIIAQISVIDMFIAGFLPCIMLLIILSIYSVFMARRYKIARIKFSWKEMGQALWEAKWEAVIPIVVLGGIYSGYFAVSEAASITAFYVFIVEVFIYRELNFKELMSVIRQSMVMVGGILIILASAMASANFFIDAQIPDKLCAYISSHVSSKIMFLLLLNIFALVLGMMIEIFSTIVIVVPLITPIAKQYDINLIHLGIIFLANMEISYLIPPLGLNLLISSFRFKKPMVELTVAALPFVGLLILGQIIITYVPDVSLILLKWMGKTY